MSLCQGSGFRRDIGLLKAKRNWNRETKPTLTRDRRTLPWHGATRHNMPSKFSKRLLKRAPLEATHNKEFARFD